jgi:predicted ATPase/DNA-binding CsgD family transcriptional regulator
MISSPLVAPRLVGREREGAFLLRSLQGALEAGPGRLVLIEGEAGIGKSRLLAEAVWRTADLGALAVFLQAFEHLRDPYAAVVLGIARAIDDAPPTVLGALNEIAAALDVDAKVQKAKRLASVTTAVRRIARESGVAFFFEDVHWADRASMDLLLFLSRELAAERFFVGATLRPQETRAELLARSRIEADTVRLGPLPPPDVTTLLRESLRGRGSLSADRIRRIVELSGGNPLFALELLRNALAGGNDTDAHSVAYPILARLERLDAETRGVLEAASVVEHIDPAFLATLLQIDPAGIEAALERAQRRAFVGRDRTTGTWRFEHALTQATVESRIAGQHRIALHRRVGELLEREGPDADAARLAHHWGFTEDRERTARYSEAAGDRAAALHDYEAAMRCFEASIRSAGDDPATAARLSEKLADAAMIEASTSRAREAIEVALRAYSELEDAAGLTRMHLHRSRLHWYDGDAASALADGERARDAAATLGPSAALFHAHVRLGQLHQLAGRHVEAQAELDAAETLLAHGSEKERIPFYNTRAMLRADAWDIDGFIADYRSAIELARAIGHTELMVSTQNNFALNAYLTGQGDVALAALEESVATSYELGMRWHASNHLLSLARVRQTFGDIGEARKAMYDMLSSGYEARRLDVWIAGIGIPIALAACDEALLDRCAIEGTLDQALSSGDAFCIATVSCAYVELLASRGSTAEIPDVLGRALDALREDARPLFLCPQVARYGRDGDVARARRLLAAPERDRARTAERALFDAYVAARKRRRTEALARAREAADIYAELHWVLDEAQALEVAERPSDALRIYRAAGSVRDVARLEALAEASDPLRSLTPREREVTELVLGGCSNREAALKLGLSERTIGNHLQSVFNRLGVTSRRELAAYVSGSGAGAPAGSRPE